MEYKKLTRLLLPHAVEIVMKAKRATHERMIEQLHEIEFITKEVIKGQNSISIVLQILDEEKLGKYLAGDANRFLLASRFSLNRALQSQNENAAWQTVEHYYAAYYAVHYLIRLTGISLTNLEQDSIDCINLYHIGPQTVQIPTGLYTLTFNQSIGTLTLTKKIKKPGGSHVDAWQLWTNLVDKLNNTALSDPIEYINTSLDLKLHRNFIEISSGNFRPTDHRNGINYKFQGDSWSFEKNANKKIGKIQSAISSTSSSISSAQDLIGLIENNSLIIGLAKQMFLHIADSYPKSICSSMSNKYKQYFGTEI